MLSSISRLQASLLVAAGTRALAAPALSRACLAPLAAQHAAMFHMSALAAQAQDAGAGASAETQAGPAEGAPQSPEESSAGEAGAAGSAEAPADAQLQELQAQVAALKDDKLRLLADMENVRSIARRDVESAKTYAISSFAKKMLDVADNLERALDAVPPEFLAPPEGAEDEPTPVEKMLQSLHQGVTATDRELHKVFAAHGIVRFGEVGDEFDPHKYDALFQLQSETVEVGKVGLLMKRGYTFKDRVLRPAQVGTVRE